MSRCLTTAEYPIDLEYSPVWRLNEDRTSNKIVDIWLIDGRINVRSGNVISHDFVEFLGVSGRQLISQIVSPSPANTRQKFISDIATFTDSITSGSTSTRLPGMLNDYGKLFDRFSRTNTSDYFLTGPVKDGGTELPSSL